MKKLAKTLSLFLAVALFCGAAAFSPAKAFENVTTFTDVENDPNSGWYADTLYKMVYYGIINGMEDGNFHPNDTITKGQFIKMIGSASENLLPYKDNHRDGMTHWSEHWWGAMADTGVLEIIESSQDANGNLVQKASNLIPLNATELDKPISRYEMAFIISNLLYMVDYERKMELTDSSDSFANHIADYGSMNKVYTAAVEQAYSKGILTGFEDTSFQGDTYLTRAQAAMVADRYLFKNSRVNQIYVKEAPKVEIETPAIGVSFAIQYRSLSNAERRQALFGNANKTYFANATEAAPYMQSVEVPIWKLSGGVKVSSKAWITVNKVVAAEVKAIFTDIYNSPEMFPIKAVGGARYSDTLRHSWGAAIDINPVENYYVSYRTGQQVGTCCWSNAANYPNIDARYCITPTGSVVTAFAKYGWGWGGQGWTSGVDYMHFSILSSGG